MVTPDDIISNIIRYHVVRLREALGWKQEDLAERMGVKFQYVSQIETGKRGVGKRTFKKLIRAFNVSEGELLQMPEEMGSAELREQWKNFYELNRGENSEIFSKIINLLIKTENPSILSALESQIDFLLGLTPKPKEE